LFATVQLRKRFGVFVKRSQHLQRIVVSGRVGLPDDASLYCTPDLPEWKKARNRDIRVAVEVLESLAGSTITTRLKKDWNAGYVWLLSDASHDVVIGSWDRRSWESGSLAWTWIASSLDLISINIDRARETFTTLGAKS
jgi:hypothetical protein